MIPDNQILSGVFPNSRHNIVCENGVFFTLHTLAQTLLSPMPIFPAAMMTWQKSPWGAKAYTGFRASYTHTRDLCGLLCYIKQYHSFQSTTTWIQEPATGDWTLPAEPAVRVCRKPNAVGISFQAPEFYNVITLPTITVPIATGVAENLLHLLHPQKLSNFPSLIKTHAGWEFEGRVFENPCLAMLSKTYRRGLD